MSASTSSRARRWRSAVAVVGAAALVLISIPAIADNIGNNLDTSLDSTAEVMPLNTGGATGSTTLYVVPTNSDGKNGCNLTGSTTLTVSVTSSDTSVATVSPSSITFTACGNTPTVTVTPHAAGSATVSVAQTANTTTGTFSFSGATFDVTVAPPANTAPTLEVTGVDAGASYDKGSVPTATCQVTDAEDGNSSFAATLSAVTGPYASDGIGDQTASCSYTDGGGLMASASKTYSIVDPTAPVISYVLDPTAPDGSNGWYKSEVTLAWSVTDPESPNSIVKTGCVDQDIVADQGSTSYSCSATSAGGSADEVTVTLKRDGTAPTITDAGFSAGTAGANGWYVSPVTESFTASDATSGLAGCTSPFTKSSGATEEGSSVTIPSGTCSDNAGNTAASVDSAAYKIDLTDPTDVSFVGGPADGGSYYFGSVPAAPTCTANDAVSGLASCLVAGYSSAVGSHTLTATATDNAGRTSTATRSYTVLAWTLSGFYQPVDMGGVLNTVKGGSTVPLKFEIFAGSTELTDTADVKSFTTKQVTCPGSATPTDGIEVTTTGGTSLRYDTTGGQFIQNWKTPTGAGQCYSTTMTTLDGSTLVAMFKLK